MKSHINQLADYREMPFEKEVTIHCPEEYIQKQMKHLTRNFKKNEPVTTLEKGDVTILSLESALEKFNRPAVYITVGGGLFDKELEAQLIGQGTGEPFEVSVNGKTVKVAVKQATRTIFPEPTDEMAAAYAKEHDEFAECTTLEKYRSHIIQNYCDEKKREALYGVMDEILNYVLTKSDWEFDEEELHSLESDIIKEVESQLKEQNKTLDTLSQEEYQNYFGVDSAEEVRKVLRQEAEQNIAIALWTASVTGKDTKESSLEELQEENNWDFLENYVKENFTIREEN